MRRRGGMGIRTLVVAMGLVIVAGLYNLSFAWEVGIWDNDATGWTTTFADGDPIDTGTADSTALPQLAIDSNGVVYVTYWQWDGTSYHLYLSRYNGTDVHIWDTTGWTTTFADGDPIDFGTANGAGLPQMAIDSQGVLYVTYWKPHATGDHIYLCRYDKTDVRIWDNDAKEWTTTFADGDPIDAGMANSACLPQLAIDSNDVVYVTYDQSDGTDYHVYLSSAYPTPCTAAVAEIDPTQVNINTQDQAFSYAIEPTISIDDSGVDTIAITVPGTYSNVTVADVLVGGSSATYTDNTSGNTISVTLATTVTTNGTDLRIAFTADTPAAVDAGVAFTATLDDTSNPDPVSATSGDGDGGGAVTTNTWTVTATSPPPDGGDGDDSSPLAPARGGGGGGDVLLLLRPTE